MVSEANKSSILVILTFIILLLTCGIYIIEAVKIQKALQAPPNLQAHLFNFSPSEDGKSTYLTFFIRNLNHDKEFILFDKDIDVKVSLGNVKDVPITITPQRLREQRFLEADSEYIYRTYYFAIGETFDIFYASDYQIYLKINNLRVSNTNYKCELEKPLSRNDLDQNFRC